MNEVLASAAPLYALLAREGETFEDGRVAFSLTTHRVGEIELPTGELVATDPLTNPDRPPFTRRLHPGTYPVDVSVARLENGDERVAAATLQLSDAPVETWAYAVTPEQNLAELADDHFLGFAVDAGTGCYGAPEALATLDGDLVISALERTYVHTWSVAVVDGVAVYHSGFGDGIYPTVFGLDAGGMPAVALTDLFVVDALSAAPATR